MYITFLHHNTYVSTSFCKSLYLNDELGDEMNLR